MRDAGIDICQVIRIILWYIAQPGLCIADIKPLVTIVGYTMEYTKAQLIRGFDTGYYQFRQVPVR